MRKYLLTAATALLLQATPVIAEQWQLAWTAENIPSPESVAYDASREVLFVSTNQDHGIDQLSLSGKVIKKDWITGLNAPKGVAIAGDTLYVSDVTDLVEIDIPSAKIVKRYAGKGAEFLNDVTIDKHGAVYVSDMFTSAIYRLDKKGDFTLWLQSPVLENPNGLLAQGDTLYIAAWGAFTNGKPFEAPQGHVLKVSLLNKKITKVSDNIVGNLDGIQRESTNTLLVSDWMKGGIFRISQGKATKVIPTKNSAADIAYLPEQNMLLIPMAKQNQVKAFKRVK